jgi:hypothetical protein
MYGEHAQQNDTRDQWQDNSVTGFEKIGTESTPLTNTNHANANAVRPNRNVASDPGWTPPSETVSSWDHNNSALGSNQCDNQQWQQSQQHERVDQQSWLSGADQSQQQPIEEWKEYSQHQTNQFHQQSFESQSVSGSEHAISSRDQNLSSQHAGHLQPEVSEQDASSYGQRADHPQLTTQQEPNPESHWKQQEFSQQRDTASQWQLGTEQQDQHQDTVSQWQLGSEQQDQHHQDRSSKWLHSKKQEPLLTQGSNYGSEQRLQPSSSEWSSTRQHNQPDRLQSHFFDQQQHWQHSIDQKEGPSQQWHSSNLRSGYQLPTSLSQSVESNNKIQAATFPFQSASSSSTHVVCLEF